MGRLLKPVTAHPGKKYFSSLPGVSWYIKLNIVASLLHPEILLYNIGMEDSLMIHAYVKILCHKALS